MGPLQPRATSVSVTTYVATSVVLGLWILAMLAVVIYLIFLQRHRAQRATSFNRSTSYGNTAPRFPSGDLTALPSYPQRAQVLPYAPSDPSSLSASTRLPNFSPIHSPLHTDPVPPSASPGIQSSGRTATVSPTRYRVPATPSTHEAPQRDLPANNTSQAAMLARLQAMPLASDTTDMSAETVDPGKQVVNANYMAMLAQRGVAPRDHALLGSDDSTDTGGGGGPGAGLSYALRARGMSPSDWGIDARTNGARFMSHGGRGRHQRAMTFGQEIGEEEPERVLPLHVRKMPSV